MTGIEQFLSLFGNITISQIVVVILALVFGWQVYRQVSKFLRKKQQLLLEKHETEKEKDRQLQELFEEVNKYPQYREQSRQIQQKFQNQIDDLKDSQEKLVSTQQDMFVSLKSLKETIDKRERNKLQDKLLQSYRYYTDIKKNPEQQWTPMESQAFWDLFSDYEEVGGNGYMHTTVMPAMKLLKIVEKE